MAKHANFREFLEREGVLREWVEIRLKALESGSEWLRPSRDIDPAEWVIQAFHWPSSPSGGYFWGVLDEKWMALCGADGLHRRSTSQVESGMPLNDEFGLRLLLAELEDTDGRA